MVRPILDYCGFLTDGGPAWAIRKLQTLQNDGLRACEKILNPIDVDDLHVRSGVTKLKVTRDWQLLAQLHKLSKKTENVLDAPRILRGNDKIRLKCHRAMKQIYEKSPMNRGLILRNALDADIQHTDTTKELTTKLKNLRP